MSNLMVLHAVPDLRRAAGGIAAVLPALCEALREEGVESRILTFSQDESDALADRTTLLPERFPWALARRMRAETARWREEAHRGGRDFICHSHGIWSFLNHGLATAARAERAPLAISMHGMLLPWARRHKAMRKAVAWRLYQERDLARADATHVTSEAERAAAEAAGVHGPFAVIPFGVDLPQTEAAIPAAPAAPAAASRASVQQRTLLFLGRVHPIKNIDGLIVAFARAKLDGWRLRIVGPDDGGHREALWRLAQELGVADRLNFEEPAFGEAKARLLEQTDLLILPSHSENFGVVVAEALAYGTPAIASTGTPWSALESQSCGWWVSPEPDELAATLRFASLMAPEALRAMGARGRAYVQTHLTWPTCARRMTDLYRSLAAQGGRGQPLSVSMS
jgi:glycosyltransferase involved in cell wall biosynthesis